MADKNKTTARYRRKLLKLQKEKNNLEYKVILLEAHLETADAKLREFEVPSAENKGK